MSGTTRVVAVVVASVCLACGVESPAPSGGEPLWIAAVQTSGALIPFARHGDDGWDLPWPAPFDAETGALADGGEAPSPPRPDRGAPSLPMPPVDQDSRGGRIAAPMQWRFYSQTEQGSALTVARLMLAEAHCMMSWALVSASASCPRSRGRGTSPASRSIASSRSCRPTTRFQPSTG